MRQPKEIRTFTFEEVMAKQRERLAEPWVPTGETCSTEGCLDAVLEQTSRPRDRTRLGYCPKHAEEEAQKIIGKLGLFGVRLTKEE